MSLLKRANELGDRIADALLTRSTVDLIRILTLLMLLMQGPRDWYVRAPMILLGLAGIVLPAARSSPRLWFALAIFILAHDIVNWSTVDNHKWLMGWWCLAMGLIACAPQASQLSVLQVNARLLLGLCFAFATLWKLLSVDYLDGTFFKWELLTDKRFRDAAHYVGGMDRGDLEDNRKLESDIEKSYRKDAEPVDSATLVSVPRIDLLAIAMTWWTIFIEGCIALFCLWPGDRIIAIIRGLVVFVFAATTYLLAPVLGFGWMVIVMGLAQCPEQHRKLRASLLLVLGLIYVYRLKLGPMLLKTAEVGFAEMARFY